MVALQALFAADMRGGLAETSLDWLLEEEPLVSRARDFTETLLSGVGNNGAALDQLIQRYAPAWPVNQLSLIDRNILRLALYELLYHVDTPPKTAVNEAVELAKIFGSESSARFVNGVLGSVMAGLEAGELALVQPPPEGR
jgi:N utilization substance protein B